MTPSSAAAPDPSDPPCLLGASSTNPPPQATEHRFPLPLLNASTTLAPALPRTSRMVVTNPKVMTTANCADYPVTKAETALSIEGSEPWPLTIAMSGFQISLQDSMCQTRRIRRHRPPSHPPSHPPLLTR